MKHKRIILAAMAVGLFAVCPQTVKGGQDVEKTVSLFQQGEIPQEEEAKQADECAVEYADAAEAIRADILQMNTQTDLSSYDMTADDVAAVYQSVVNHDSGLFYASENLTVSCDESGIAEVISYTYTAGTAELETQKAEYYQALNRIVAQVDKNWTDVQKALFVNDYLTSTVIYDQTLLHHDAYSLLVNQTGVCQAYALAYRAIMEELGIPAIMVSSAQMNHAWNEIYVNDHWYHVDVTWNDPDSDVYGRADHYFFLLSDAAMEKGGRLGLCDEHIGWYKSIECNDTTFDDYFWKDIENPIVCCNGSWYTLKSSKILQIDWQTGTTEEIASYADTGESLRTGLIPYNGLLYVTTADKLLSFDTETKTFSVVLSMPDVWGIANDAGVIRGCSLSGNYTDSDLTDLMTLYTLGTATDAQGFCYIPGVWKQAVLVSGGDQAAVSVPQTVSLTPAEGETADYTVVQIGAGTFYGNKSLSSIELPETVTGIGAGAFYGAENLTTVDVRASHISVGDNAFYGCKNLNTFAGNGVRIDSVGENAFYGCERIQTIDTTSLKAVPARAFYGCSSLNELQLSAADLLETAALQNCTGLTRVSLKASVRVIPTECFSGCTSLEEIILPEQLQAIEEHAFYQCSKITSMVVPATVTEIGEGAWQECENLQSVNFPSGITEIPAYSFSGCSALPSFEFPEGVTAIGDHAFAGCTSIQGLDLPQTLTEIDICAFMGSGLTDVAVPEGVTTLNNGVFAECVALKSVTLPETIETMGNTFRGCMALEEIVIPAKITEIATQVFYQCSSLKKIEIPSAVTAIGEYAFYQCGALEEISLPDGITEIGKYAFSGCSALSVLRLPKAVTTVGKGMADGCTSLKEIQLDEENINFSVYQGVLYNKEKTELIACPGTVRHLYLPEEYASIGEDFYQSMPFLKSLTVPNPSCEIADSQKTLKNLALYGEPGSTLAAYAAKYGNPFNVETITEPGEYQQTLAANGNISWQFAPEEAGTYFVLFYCDAQQEVSISYGKGNNGGAGVVYLTETLQENETDTFIVKPSCWQDDTHLESWPDGVARTVTVRIYRQVEKQAVYSAPGNYTISLEPYTVCLLNVKADGASECKFRLENAKGLYWNEYQQSDIGWEYVLPNDKAVQNGTVASLELTNGTATLRINPYMGKNWNPAQDDTKAQSVTLYLGSEAEKTPDSEETEETEESEESEHTHTVVKDKAIAATCTQSGLTEGSHCSTCNQVLVAQKKIPATGHSWDSGTVTKKATVTEAGVKTYKCSKCGTTKTESIAKLIVKYTIVFNGNGSTDGTMNSQKVTYGNGATLTANAFTRKGYSFTGWNTKTDGSGTAYKNQADGSTLTKTDGSTVTLYAQWKANKYTVKFNGNGAASGSVKALKDCKYGKSYKLTANSFKRKGYTFTGWNTKKNGSGKTYKNKAQIKNLTTKSGGMVTLYAQWKANKYTVKFNGNRATSGSMKTLKNCQYGKSYKLKSNPYKKKGYTFAGWNTKKNGSGKTYKNKAQIKNLTTKSGGTVTLYAQWKKKK